MWLSDTSVKRPVFATVLSLMLVALGALAFRDLTVREYPDTVAPTVQVQVNYPGASSEIVETRVTQVLEGELSGIEGVKTIRSSSRDGQSSITVEFDLKRRLDEAANDVRDRVSRVTRRLPDDIDNISVQKADADQQPVMWLTLAGEDMSMMELTDYMQRYLIDRFATIPGVSQINIFGSGGPSMRVWIDRIALAARNLTVTDIEAALGRENLELPAGKIQSKDRDFQVRIGRNYQTAEQFRDLVLAQGKDGHLIRLGEVARVEVGSRETQRYFHTNGKTTTGFGIIKQSTANVVEVLDAVKAEVARVNRDLPKGMNLITSGDDSLYIRAAIREIYYTIAITTALVGFVIFVFLGSVRATLIPLVTIPVCLIATFSVLSLFGYSINLITLLALALSIGLVVDDAIVVLENAHRRIEAGEAPLLAAYNGTRQVAFAVIATTVVLVSVFAPVAFLKDSIGRVFAELAVTIAAAVTFSAVLSLSLSPMMCSKLLRAHTGENRLTHKLDRGFEWLSNRYQAALRASLRAPWVALLVCVAIGFGAYALLQRVPREYAPQEDRGQFNASLQAPEGTSYDRLVESAQKVESYLQPYFDDGTIQRGVVSVPGFQPGTSGNVNVTLKPWGERKVATADLLAVLNKDWEEIPDMRITAFISGGNRGGGGGGGQPVQIVLGGPNYIELARWRDIVIASAAANPGLSRVDSDLRETQPQVLVRVDTDRAASLGVSARSIGSTLQTLMSERQVTTYVVDGEEYDVVLTAEPTQRATYADLSNIFVRSDRGGDLIPLSNLTKLEDMAGPSQLNRHNRMRAVTITANLVNGYTLGEALTWLEDVIHKELPATVQVGYRGESLDYKEASGALYFTFGVALFVVFLVLAAQFESFIHPLVIMVTVPLAVAGGLLGLWASGKTLNIYSQIGIIMLVGIAAKNGVLIVEFINQLRDRGMEFKDAIVEASRIRLRPVIMTAFAAVMGSVPLILAHGPGSASRQALGVVIFSGVSLATLFTLFIVPAVYNLLARRTGSPNAIARRLATMRTEVSPG
ncbi:MAG TPA: efflux RND transporter permease subunit [Gammaproteobacteria bacterium]|jgi:multidrug efflux pump|nr:efflux RND transporter permease subunit [Gammaproteobacteria bacterium]